MTQTNPNQTSLAVMSATSSSIDADHALYMSAATVEEAIAIDPVAAAADKRNVNADGTITDAYTLEVRMLTRASLSVALAALAVVVDGVMCTHTPANASRSAQLSVVAYHHNFNENMRANVRAVHAEITSNEAGIAALLAKLANTNANTNASL
jgi:hypothetical protein